MIPIPMVPCLVFSIANVAWYSGKMSRAVEIRIVKRWIRIDGLAMISLYDIEELENTISI